METDEQERKEYNTERNIMMRKRFDIIRFALKCVLIPAAAMFLIYLMNRPYKAIDEQKYQDILKFNMLGRNYWEVHIGNLGSSHGAYDFVYDGTYYQLVGDVDSNTTYTPAAAAPKAAGTAAVGTSAKYAREDHVHPAQTTVSGNAGTATKLATARTVRTNLASTSTASFDGSANITPGVTGVLPVANGGTGNTTNTAADSTKWNGAAKTVSTANPSGGANGDIWFKY